MAFDKEKRKSNDYYVNALENCYEYAIDKDPHEQNQTEFDESEDIKIVWINLFSIILTNYLY